MNLLHGECDGKLNSELAVELGTKVQAVVPGSHS